MALVLLPCDLPTWPTVQRHLHQLKQAQTADQLIDVMNKLHNLCCVGLDPDEDQPDDVGRFDGLKQFLEQVFSETERQRFFDVTLPSLITSALRLKALKPVCGLHFSLQQQADRVTLERPFLMTLIANAFFSTFPKRTEKTHPTLQDFNFSRFYAQLDRCEQQAKLRSIFHYFDQAVTDELHGNVTLARQVLPKWDRQSLDDWLCCSRPLCPLIVRHEGRHQESDIGTYQICFSSSKPGGKVLIDGWDQEEVTFCTCPELLVTLLYVESLEANESLSAHNWIRVGHVQDSKKFCPSQGTIINSWDSHLSIIDAGDYSKCPLAQYKEQNLLRELTKAYLGFQQVKPNSRLSPIGQSCSSTPHERSSTEDLTNVASRNQHSMGGTGTAIAGTRGYVGNKLAGLVKAASTGSDKQPVSDVCASISQVLPVTQTAKLEPSQPTPPLSTCQKGLPSTLDSGVGSQEASSTLDSARLIEKLSYLAVPEIRKLKRRNFSEVSELSFKDALSTQSSFCSVPEEDEWSTPMEPQLPPSHISDIRPLSLPANSVPSSATTSNSSSTVVGRAGNGSHASDDEEEYQSCSEELEDEVEPVHGQLPGPDLVSSRGRWLLAESLRGAIRRSCSSQSDIGEDSSYSLDIHIAGPDVHDREEIRVRRVPSTGFLLDEDDCFAGDGLEAEQAWLHQFRQRSQSRSVSRCNSSRYSFSSDFSSDLEEIYEHFEEMMKEGPVADDPAVAKYVGGLLKRTLSDSLTMARYSSGSGDLMPRSLSLADHLTHERLALEQAKRKQDVAPGKIPPATTMGAEAGDDGGVGRKLSGQLVSIVIEQSLAEVEEKVALELPKEVSDNVRKHLHRLYSDISVWWNYNDTYEFNIDLGKFGSNGKGHTDFNDEDKTQRNSPNLIEVCCEQTPHNSLSNISNADSDTDSGVAVRTEINRSGSMISTFTPDSQPKTPSSSSSQPKDAKTCPQTNLRRWLSRSASELPYQTDAPMDGNDLHCSELRKWGATVNLNDNDDKPNSCPPSLPPTRPLSRTIGAGQYGSLESLCPRTWSSHNSLESGEADSDQLWLLLDPTDNSRDEDDDDDIDFSRKRVHSFSGMHSQCLGSLRRTSSDPHHLADYTFPSRFLGLCSDEENLAPVRTSGSILSRHGELFSTLQSIAESREAEESNLSPSTPVGSPDGPPNFCSSVSVAQNDHHASPSASSSTPSSSSQQLSGASSLPGLAGSKQNGGPEADAELCSPSKIDIRLDIEGCRPIATSNWGCGSYAGDPQLKVVIQWLAASRADAPCLFYYVSENSQLLKLDTVGRILRDRHWTVGNLAKAMLTHCKSRQDGSVSHITLFDDILPKDMHQLSWSSTQSQQSAESLD